MKTFMQKENEGCVSLTTDERMFLEGSAGISVCSPGRQGQKNSSWQQCFNGWLQGRRQAERKLFRIQIISQQIHVNFYQDKRPPAHFCPGFCKNHFWLQGVFRLQPILSFVQRETPLRFFFIFSVVFVILYIYLELRRKTSFSQDLSPEEAPGGRQSQRCEPVAKKSSTEHIYKYI